MFKSRFSLLVTAIILLSPTLVDANEINDGMNISVGNIQVQTSDRDGVNIQTPKIKLNTGTPYSDRISSSRNRRRYRSTVRRTRTYQPDVFQRRSDRDEQVSTNSSTIRSSSNVSHSINQQHQSIQCSQGSGRSVSQSTQTINGRTVRSEVYTNCQ